MALVTWCEMTPGQARLPRGYFKMINLSNYEGPQGGEMISEVTDSDFRIAKRKFYKSYDSLY